MSTDLSPDGRAKLRAHYPGCLDHGCQVRKPKGQGTNAGCRCLPDIKGPGRRGVFTLAKQMLAALDRIDALEARVRELEESETCWPHEWQQTAGGILECANCGERG